MINKRQIATLVQRFPWVGQAFPPFYRLIQPWVTVGAVGVIFNTDGHMLIVEHVFHPRFPWGLPGGWMSRHEDPAQTVAREVMEETSLKVEVIKPLLITQTEFLASHLDVAFLCQLPPGSAEVHLSGELLDYRWVDPLQAPPMARFHTKAIKAALNERALIT